MPSRRKVNIKRLKDFALTLPRDSILHDLLLQEKNELEVEEFIVKMDLWLELVVRESYDSHTIRASINKFPFP